MSRAWKSVKPGIDGLEIREQPVPKPGPGEVLVKNVMASVNPVDWKYIIHLPEKANGRIPGVDGYGVIVELGEGVTQWRKGARVAYHANLNDDCSWADYIVISSKALLPVPEGMSDAAAAAFPCPILTAHIATEKARPQIGNRILVHGAGSFVGKIACQLLVAKGCIVTATASAHKHAELKKLGVVHTIDYHDANWMSTLGNEFHSIIDVVSAKSASELISHVKWNGHIVTILGRIDSNPLPSFARCVSVDEVSLGAIHTNGNDADFVELMAEGVKLMHRVMTGELKLPPIVVTEFDKLKETLTAASTNKDGTKYLIRI